LRQQGNILFLILIAVALFAALSYAVTGSSRSGGQTISQDKAKIAAAEIVQYGTQLEQAVTRLKVINGCSDTQLSFERAPFDGSDTAYLNPNAPPDFRCHVFHPTGGGVVYRLMDLNVLDADNDVISTANLYGDWHVNAVSCIEDVGLGAFPNCVTGVETTELILYLPYLKRDVCSALNNNLEVTEISGDAPTTYNNQQVVDSGAFTFKGIYYSAAKFTSIWRGVRAGCFKRASGSEVDAYVYFHVLLAR
jgi:hypothetical protein